MAFIGRNAHQ